MSTPPHPPGGGAGGGEPEPEDQQRAGSGVGTCFWLTTEGSQHVDLYVLERERGSQRSG
jgi:hypothetical protein